MHTSRERWRRMTWRSGSRSMTRDPQELSEFDSEWAHFSMSFNSLNFDLIILISEWGSEWESERGRSVHRRRKEKEEERQEITKIERNEPKICYCCCCNFLFFFTKTDPEELENPLTYSFWPSKGLIVENP